MKITISSIALMIILSSCDPVGHPETPDPAVQDVFFERLTLLCGKAYSGKLVSHDKVDADMSDKPMIMHAAKCNRTEIQIPFHVHEGVNEGGDDWNRSRAWIITRTKSGLRLKHRHRHEDGTLDAVTNYGGDTLEEGSESGQEFPVDDESIAWFKTNELGQSITNVWKIEISPPGKRNAHFAYELRRPKASGGRHFRVEFDLSKPVEVPPAAWGD